MQSPPPADLSFRPGEQNFSQASVKRLGPGGRGLADPRLGGRAGLQTCSPPCPEPRVPRWRRWRLENRKPPALLASQPQPVIPTWEAPRPPLPAAASLVAGTSNHHAHPRFKHLPDVGREEKARCGEADVSARSLVGALVRKLDGQAFNHPREAGLGLRGHDVARPCSIQERPTWHPNLHPMDCKVRRDRA